MQDKKGMAVASLVLGLVSVVGWLLPLVGFPTSILGLIFGIVARNSSKRKMAIAGIILSAVFLLATLVNSIIGAILVANMLKQ